ncbi:MAG: WD40 repeat domain-containing protein [Fimbriiglobus sp.]
MRSVNLKGVKSIQGLHFTPNGDKILLATGVEARGMNLVWLDVHTMTEITRFKRRGGPYAVSKDLKRIVTAQYNSGANAIDSVEDGEVRTLPLPNAENCLFSFMMRFAFDSTGEQLVVSHALTFRRAFAIRLMLLKFPSMVLSRQFEGAVCPGAMAFSPDGCWLALDGILDGEAILQFLELTGEKRNRRFATKHSPTSGLAYSPDGKLLFSVNGRNVHRLNSETAQKIGPSLKHPMQVNALSFSPDGQRLLTACQDRLARLWDVASGEVVKTYDWGLGSLTAITFAPEGLTAIAGDYQGHMVLWDID